MKNKYMIISIIIVVIGAMLYIKKDIFTKENIITIINNNLKDKDSFLSAFVNKQEEMIDKELEKNKIKENLIIELKQANKENKIYNINITESINQETKDLFIELKNKNELNTFKINTERFVKEKDKNKFQIDMFNDMIEGISTSKDISTFLKITLIKKDNTTENIIKMYELNKMFYIDTHYENLITKENIKEYNPIINNLLKDYLKELNKKISEKEIKEKEKKEETIKVLKSLL